MVLEGVHGEREIDAFDEQLDLGAHELADELQALEHENMASMADAFVDRARRRLDHRRRLHRSSLAVALDDAVGDEAEQAGAVRARSCRAWSCRFASATISRARDPDLLQRPGGGDPVAERLGRRGVEAVQVDRADPGVRCGGLDQRQGHGAVEQVGAAGLAGPLRRAGDVEDVVEQLESEADLSPELRAGARRRGRAGRRTRTASRSSAGNASR